MAHRPLTVEEVWRRYDDAESRLTAPVSERMLDLVGVAQGLRVLDLATGRGEPAIRAAQRVGPTGHVLGVDSAAAMLQMAREKIVAAGLENIELRAVAAESIDGLVAAASFDAVTIRWGLMYMADPALALAGARRALQRGGALVAALWAEPERVSYFTLPRRVLASFRPLPPIDFEAPGTFRHADPARIARDFAEACLDIVHVEELDVPVIEADSAADLVAWVRALGLTRLLSDLPEEVQLRWEEKLARAAEPLRRAGRFYLGGVTRLVVARPRP